MSIESNIPQVATLRQRVEGKFGSAPRVHSDFCILVDDIFDNTREHLSETTLERLWNYSTRRYDTVSRRTLDVLCRYIDLSDWEAFLMALKEETGNESDMFDAREVNTDNLKPGDRLRIGWQPDRVCVVRYLGANRFVAEETLNAKLNSGDTFSCSQFMLHSPLYLENLTDDDGMLRGKRYGVALQHGLTMLQILGK